MYTILVLIFTVCQIKGFSADEIKVKFCRQHHVLVRTQILTFLLFSGDLGRDSLKVLSLGNFFA